MLYPVGVGDEATKHISELMDFIASSDFTVVTREGTRLSNIIDQVP